MTRPSAHRRGYTRSWQRIVRDAIAVHVRLYGWTCPGWGVPAHHSSDLTGDHELAVSRGGQSTAANVQILCRGCNARKGRQPVTRVQLTLEDALEAPQSPTVARAREVGTDNAPLTSDQGMDREADPRSRWPSEDPVIASSQGIDHGGH